MTSASISPARREIAGTMRPRRTTGTRRRTSRSSRRWTVRPSVSAGLGGTRLLTVWTSCPRRARRCAQRRKLRDFASPRPRMRSCSLAIRGGSAREDDHLLVVRMTPVALVRHGQAGAFADGAQRLEVVVVLVAVGIGDHALRLLDLAEVRLPLRVLVDRRVEAAAGPEDAGHLDQAAHDRVQGKVREHRLGDRVVERLPELAELEVLVHEQQRRLVLEALPRELHLGSPFEPGTTLVDTRVVPRLEVADEMHAGAQRPATDVEQVVLRLEPQLAEVVPEGGVPPHRAAVPVAIPDAVVALGDRAPNPALDPDRNVLLDPAEDRLPVSCHGCSRTLSVSASV